MLVYLLLLLCVVAWQYVPRRWHPAITLEAPHHLISSSASPAQTTDTAQALRNQRGAQLVAADTTSVELPLLLW